MPNIIWVEVVKKDISNREVTKIMIWIYLNGGKKNSCGLCRLVDEDSLAHTKLIRIKA